MANTRDVLGDKATLAGLVGNTLTEFEEDSVPELRDYAFYERTALQSVKMPGTTVIGLYAFRGCTGLKEISEDNFPNVTEIKTSAFYSCINLTKVTLEKVSRFGDFAFAECTKLACVELSSSTVKPYFATDVFKNNKSLNAVIIRYVGDSVPTLVNLGTFKGTKIGVGAGAVYVPSSMVEKYRAATNWSAFRIESIDNYPITNFDTIQDSWEQIAAKVANGTAATAYNVGDTKTLDLGTEGQIRMEIVAKNADAIASGGTAQLTWVAKTLLNTKSKFIPDFANDVTWAQSVLRSYLIDTIWAKIPTEVQGMIKEVTKYSDIYQGGSSGSIVHNDVTTDKLWVPSSYETGATSSETLGPTYGSHFDTAAKRARYDENMNESYWYVRSAYTQNYCNSVTAVGDRTTKIAMSDGGVLLCFCT